jgi:predicted adenine nucleotide alpha hydrolase (AANH) superfamily ATPase
MNPIPKNNKKYLLLSEANRLDISISIIKYNNANAKSSNEYSYRKEYTIKLNNYSSIKFSNIEYFRLNFSIQKLDIQIKIAQ